MLNGAGRMSGGVAFEAVPWLYKGFVALGASALLARYVAR